MDEKDSFSSVPDDIAENSVKAAKETADAIRSAKKIAAKAAAGNYAGAAVEAVKNPKVIAIILIIAMLVPLLTAIFFYAAPIAIYETLNSVFKAVLAEWDNIRADFYSSGGGLLDRIGTAAKGMLSRAWSGLSGSMSGIWNSLTAEQTSDSSGKDADTLSDSDTGVLGSESETIRVFQRKVDAIKGKITSRCADIETRIQASCSAPVNNTGTVNGWIYNNLFLPRDSGTYTTYDASWWADAGNYSAGVEMPDDVVEVVYGGVNCVTAKQAVKTKTAVDILALYSAMHNTTAENVKVYELMKWMGYRGSGTDTFVVGEAVTIGIPSWTGTFMPMYLEDEKAEMLNHSVIAENIYGEEAMTDSEIKSLFDSSQTSAADLLITLSTPPLSGLTGQVTLESFEHYEKIKDAYTATVTSTDTVAVRWYEKFEVKPENNKYVQGKYGVDYKYVSVNGKTCKQPLTNYGCLPWIRENGYSTTETVTTTETTNVPAEFGYVVRNRAVVTYTLNVSLGIRASSALEEIAGFTDKPENYTPAQTETEP